MARNEDEGYDWINDPFDDSKNPEDQFKMSKKSKAAIVVAVLIIVVIVVVLAVFGFASFMSAMIF